MKQNDRRIRGRAGLAVEDLVALNVGMLVRSHMVPLIVNPIVCVISSTAESVALAASKTNSTTVAGDEI